MDKSSSEALRQEGEALLAWLNRLPFFGDIDDFSSEDLADGTKIWQVLREFAPQHFMGDLPRNDGSIRRRTSHVQNLQNVKKIHKFLRQYILQELQMALPRGYEDSDLNAIAEGKSVSEFASILKAVFCVGVLRTSDNEAYVLAITLIPQPQQELLMAVTQELQDAGSPHLDEHLDDQDIGAPAEPLGPDALDEEQYIRLIANNTSLEKQRATLVKDLEDRDFRLSRLQGNNMTLQRQLEDAQSSLDLASRDADQGYRLRDLEAKNKSQDDYIASLEEQMQGLQEKETSVQSELNKLRKANERVQPLQDEIDELRVARDTMSRRNNMLERYKHKVQSVQEVENENRSLRREIEETRYASQEGDGAKQSNLSLQREVRELQTLMQNTEIQLVESTNRRKQLEYEVAELLQRLEEAAAQRERDQETLAGMRETSPGLENQNSEGLFDLDRELGTSTEQDKEKGQDAKTKYERVHRFGHDEVTRSMALQKLYQDEKLKSAGLQKRNMELSKRNLSLEGIMKQPDAPEQSDGPIVVISSADFRRSTEAFTAMQSELQSANNKVEELEQSLVKSQGQFADAEKTISMYDQEKVEALETLKDQNSQENRELQARLITLETRNTDLRIELDESRSMLSQAFQQTSGNVPTETIRESLEAKAEGEEQGVPDQQLQELIEAVEQAKERERMQQEIHEKQEQTVKDLREEVRKATDKAAPSLLKASEQASLKKELENVRRENKLMSTAFFDLSSRLQMNNVSLQRRSEAPKGFLNRQRQLVNQATSMRIK